MSHLFFLINYHQSSTEVPLSAPQLSRRIKGQEQQRQAPEVGPDPKQVERDEPIPKRSPRSQGPHLLASME